jgi:hypothetical protein
VTFPATVSDIYGLRAHCDFLREGVIVCVRGTFGQVCDDLIVSDLCVWLLCVWGGDVWSGL